MSVNWEQNRHYVGTDTFPLTGTHWNNILSTKSTKYGIQFNPLLNNYNRCTFQGTGRN